MSESQERRGSHFETRAEYVQRCQHSDRMNGCSMQYVLSHLRLTWSEVILA